MAGETLGPSSASNHVRSRALAVRAFSFPPHLPGLDTLDGQDTRLSERHLRRILKDYFSHYHRWRCHQSLEMDCPEPRPVQPPDLGEVVEVVEAAGLYRHYERLAA